MDLFNKLMGGIDMESIQGMIPQPKVIESYEIIQSEDINDFRTKCNQLIQEGYEPFGILVFQWERYYHREFIKYKTTTPNVKG